MTSIEDENDKTCTHCKRKLKNIHHFSASVLVEIRYNKNYSVSYGQTKSFDIFQQDIIVQPDYDINDITSSYLDDEDTLNRELNEKFVGKSCTLEYRHKAMEEIFWWKQGEDFPVLLSLNVHGLKKPK